MLLDKLSTGVLKVLTPLGPRYIKLSLSQRVLLIWIFRHFEMLPLQVLNPWQQSLIDALCIQQQFIAMHPVGDGEGFSVIGTVERRRPVEVDPLSTRWPNARVSAITQEVRSAEQRY